MSEERYVSKGIVTHIEKDIYGLYYIGYVYPEKRAPNENKARREFYKKNNLAKRLDFNQRISKKFKTKTALKRMLK